MLLLLGSAVSSPKVFVIKWDGPITPITADYVSRAMAEAEESDAGLFVLMLDTPGGLVESTRKIVQRFGSSPLPVVVFVHPPGGRAASAGAIITIAADVAVMSPGTNIGAAHPVRLGEKREEKDVMEEKILQDMLAFVRSIASEKGRNVDVVEKMVKESLSLTAREALEKGVIDLVADNVKELLKNIHGRKITKLGREIVLQTADAEVVAVEENLKEEVLKILTNPTVAYLLMMIGFYGIFFELYNPGAVVPGVVGAISLLLGLYGLSLVDMNWLGLLLIALGILLFVPELPHLRPQAPRK